MYNMLQAIANIIFRSPTFHFPFKISSLAKACSYTNFS